MAPKKQRGFTLLELTITLAAMSILAALSTPSIIDTINQRRANVVIQETQMLMDGARAYRSQYGSWPGNATCSNAIATMQGLATPMLVGLSTQNKYSSAYTTSCTATSFSIDQTIIADWDGYIANGLPATTITNTSTHAIRSTIGIPGSEPVMDGKLSRNPESDPELNRMRTNLLMGNNDINEVDAVNARSLNAQTVAATGNISTSGYLELNGAAAEGAWCAKAGLVTTTSAGAYLSCQGNKWVKSVIWSPSLVSSGQACTRGSLAFDGTGNLYVCK